MPSKIGQFFRNPNQPQETNQTAPGTLKDGAADKIAPMTSPREAATSASTSTSTRSKPMKPLYSTKQRRNKETQNPEIDPDSVYEFYTRQIFPAILASLPILAERMGHDVKESIWIAPQRLWEFVLPAWVQESATKSISAEETMNYLGDLWERALAAPQSAAQNSTVAEFLIQNFDTNGDGHISPNELLNMTEIMNKLQQQMAATSNTKLTFWTWFSREWPLMDWKIGLFLWRTFGGLLVVLFFLSIVPGRLHSWSGKILRWPILLLTYFIIVIELMVYIVIRLVIRVAEVLVANSKHRALRKQMAQADSYESWYQYAAALDISQKRDKWQRKVWSSSRYNWALIRHLMEDMRLARAKHDVLLAEAVLQQCTRKNVGGIMSEDLFSYTNTGEPKHIVKEFIDEVTMTLRWITEESLFHLNNPNAAHDAAEENDDAGAKKKYQDKLQRKVRSEKDRLWKSVVSWATLSFGEQANGANKEAHGASAKNVTNDLMDASRARMASEHTTESDSSHFSEGFPKALPPQFHREQLIAFLKRARAAYGRTALCLSGGAMMGMYHFGHLQGLMETDSLPFIVSGTSAGSVVGSVLCTRTNEELKRDLQADVIAPKMKCFARNWPDRIKSVLRNGHMFSREEWIDMIQFFTCGQMTFAEAYKKTGRIFCITLASTTKKAPPVLLNYLTAPNVTIPSAVIASAAVPGFIPPVRLQVKDPDGTVRSAGDETYFDGSIEHDIPVNGLAEQLNCQFFIAAQCNPHVVPFFFNAKGGVGSPSRWSSGEQEASWRGGFLLAALEMYLKNDMKSKFRFLHEMEAAIGFTSTMMAQEFVGSITIVPNVRLWDFFTLFSDPTVPMLKRSFQVGSVAAYQHAAMIRLHYRIADAIDECLEKLGDGIEHKTTRVKPSRRATFEVNKKISAAVADLHNPGNANIINGLTSGQRRGSMPEIISAALNERLAECDSTSISDGSYDG